MRLPPPPNVTIVEPPLEELTKRRSGFMRGCFTGCLFFVLLIVAAGIGIRVFIGHGPTHIKNVPEYFPKNIPLYDPDAIENITLISGRYKSRSIGVASFFPKIILAPLFLSQANEASFENEAATSSAPTPPNTLWQVLQTPVGDARDTIQIEWRNSHTGINFFDSYYQNELSKQGYQVTEQQKTNHTRRFVFRNNERVNGSLYMEGGAESRTAYATLIINLPQP